MEKSQKLSSPFKQQNGRKITKNINFIIIFIFIIFLIIMICSSIYRPNTIKKDYDWVEISQTKKSVNKNQNKKYYEQWLEPLDSVREMPEFDRFIYTRTMGGGLGNQVI